MKSSASGLREKENSFNQPSNQGVKGVLLLAQMAWQKWETTLFSLQNIEGESNESHIKCLGLERKNRGSTKKKHNNK